MDLSVLTFNSIKLLIEIPRKQNVKNSKNIHFLNFWFYFHVLKMHLLLKGIVVVRYAPN